MIFYIGLKKEKIKIMEIPKMNTMRIETLSLDKIKLTLLVDQKTNGIYFSKIYDYKDSIKKVYLEFKYKCVEMNRVDFYVPLDLISKVIKIDNRIKYLI